MTPFDAIIDAGMGRAFPGAMEARQRQLLLVVDDESRATRMLARMLREDGFDVEIAFDGAAAISRLSRAPIPDALVTDVRMPHVDGVVVAKYARSRRKDMPIVFITGYPQLVQGRERELPSSVLVTKPIDYMGLSQQLAELLGQPASLDALVRANGSLAPDEVVAEHEKLFGLLAQLAGTTDGQALGEVLHRLGDYMQQHFQREEADAGLFDELVGLAPSFRARVERLVEDHGSLLEQVSHAQQQVAAGADVGEAIQALKDAIGKHERAERELLNEAFPTELPGVD